MYSRANLSRTVAILVALFLTAASTSAVAREFRAAGAENNWPSFVTTDHYKYAGYYTLLVMSLKAWQSLSAEDQKIFRDAASQSSQFMRAKWKDLEQISRRQAEAAGATIVTDFDRKPFEDAMAGIYANAQSDPAAAQLIERIRKVE